MSNPSPPTLEDPDAVKMSKDDEIVKIKNGLKEKVGEKVENGCSSDSEMKEDEVQNNSNDSDLDKNGAESKQNGAESDQNGKEKSNGDEIKEVQIDSEDSDQNEKTDSKDEESKLENGNDNSTEKDKSSEIEEDQTSPMEEEEVTEKDDENTDKTDSNNEEETLIKEKSENKEKQQDSKESESMEVDSSTAEDQTKSKKDEKDSEISFETSENVSADGAKNKEKEASEGNSLEKKESETKAKSNDGFGISFDLTKIPQHLIERRKAEEEKRKSDELKKSDFEKKPEANLELCEDDSDSDEETEDPKTPKSVASDGKNDEKNEEEEPKEEAPKDDLNYNEALENLTKIQQESKKINDEELMSSKVASGGALKRPASAEKEDKEFKKVKLELESKNTKKEVKSDEDDGTTSEIKKHLKKLTREQLENVVTEKISEIISARSEIGDLRRKVDSYEQENERWKKKQQLLQKMCMDLNTVMKRYIVDKQNSTKDKVAPIKITRSVGLQVVTDRHRRTVTAAAPIKTASPNAAQVAKTPPRPIQPAGGTLTSPGGPARAKVNGVANRPGMGVLGPASAKPHTVMQLAPVSSLTSTASSPASQNAARLHTLPSSVSIIQTPTATAVTSTVANKVASTLQQSARSTPSPAGSASGNAAATAKKVIDIVDLSDEDEDQPKSAANNSIAPVRTLQTQNGIRLVPASQLRQVQMQNKPGGAAPTYTFNSSGQVTPTFTATPQGRPGTQPGQVTHHQIIRAPAPRHPAPLPDPPRHQISNPSMKKEPPRPTLKISRLTSGIVLSWNMTVTPANHAIISSYQIYAYQETPQQKADATLWKKVGDVKALPLPMACTLTQFLKGNKYHFAVRAKDVHTRVGHFSDPQSIALT